MSVLDGHGGAQRPAPPDPLDLDAPWRPALEHVLQIVLEGCSCGANRLTLNRSHRLLECGYCGMRHPIRSALLPQSPRTVAEEVLLARSGYRALRSKNRARFEFGVLSLVRAIERVTGNG